MKLKANKDDTMQVMNDKLARLRGQVQLKVRHPYLFKFMKTPIIDEDKMLLLLSIFDRLNLPKEKAEKYAVTTMLVQIALDTHESVENQPLAPELLKGRQLTILAGTYYSGLYYKILADIDDINMIRTLAEGIMDVNEHKISVYSKSRETVESLMESLKKTESSLFDRLTAYFSRKDLGEMAGNIVFLKRLIAEKNQFIASDHSVLFDALYQLLYNGGLRKENQRLPDDQKEYLLSICDKYIDLSIKEIDKLMEQLSETAELLADRLNNLKSQHHQAVKTFVEEG
ncbi:heptaprenyl diphosphate synthase component 1 [Cytobacillus purgationiresistens]|uniref:Heptaprenyl diphosphate synthase n=1 Tax=Cytobacillus purgationiresistens TaxID=863449 RepID=A0ABU0AL20_9BACI|nr:heptaprenyl diphosphate synthase component 1 [Cytobacillus purgationiresistens]MDQ0271083.1 heptaprenyl diphosphate synthase [Cytobacillus purgationiresistens]